jgi:hypothetical protein
MTSPQEKELKEHGKKLRGNMTQGFQRVKNICTLMGIYMKIGWKPLKVHNISNIYNNICSNNNSRHMKVYRLLDYRRRKWRQNLLLQSSSHQNYKYQLVEGFPFEFELGSKLVQKMGSFIKGSKNPTTQTSTPKSMEEVVA